MRDGRGMNSEPGKRNGKARDRNPRLTRGYVHVYTGDGKGKTTAALGLALRAAGHGLRTYFGQFLKGRDCGEHNALGNCDLIEVEQYGGAGWVISGQVKPGQRARAEQGMAAAREAMLSGRYDIIVLDEINVAVTLGLLAEEDVLLLLDDRPEEVELILTGRGAPAKLIEQADLVTEMRAVKHYHQQGVQARRGIEH
jgi:cob(I)alamin adenosyltransferase